jgi:hypothetical protein
VSGEQASSAFGPKHEMVLAERGAIRQSAAPTMLPVNPETMEEALSGTSKAILPDFDCICGRDGSATLQAQGNGYPTKRTSSDFARTGCIHSQNCTHTSAYGYRVKRCDDSNSNTAWNVLKGAGTKEVAVVKNAGHFEPYFGEAFENNICAQLKFLQDFV